jgi:hypothetical protein
MGRAVEGPPVLLHDDRMGYVEMWMKLPGWLVALCVVLFISVIMAVAVLGGTKADCSPVPWYRMPGCSMALYESLSGGLIAAGGALFAGWLAWSAVREQVDIERRKLRAADIAAQATRADQVSRVVSELTTIANEGRMLLLRIREVLVDPTPYSSRFLELHNGQVFPTSPGSWMSTLTGDRIWNLVCRMRLIAQNLKEAIDREKGMGYNSIMGQANIEAAQAVDEFNVSWRPCGRCSHSNRLG